MNTLFEVNGTVIARDENQVNPNITSGAIEVHS